MNNVIIGSGINSINDKTFYNCPNLSSITIPNNITSIGKSAFYGCNKLSGVEIPSSVTSIGASAFYGCDNMSLVIIGDGVTNIESKAFNNCTNLVDVYCKSMNAPNTASDAFDDSFSEKVTLHVPEGCVNSYKAVVPWSNSKNIIDINGDIPNPTGINFIDTESSNHSVFYYTIEGKRHIQPQRGINIIKMSDGTTKKVVFK